MATKLKLQLRTQGVIVANIPKDANTKLAHLLQANNMIYLVANSTRYLGASFASNIEGARHIVSTRTKQAK